MDTHSTYTLPVSQVSIYIPDELERSLREAAEREKTSVSAYVTELIRRAVKPDRWPESFLATFGSWEGSFDIPEEPPVEERDPF